MSKEHTTEKKYQATQIDWLKGIPQSKQERPIRRMIYIHPSNVNFIKEIEQWKWKHDDKRNVYLDEPVSFFDNAMAALRYGIEGWRKPKSQTAIQTFKGGI